MMNKKKIFKICQAVFFSLVLSISIIGLGYIHKPKAKADSVYTIQSGYYTFNSIIDFNTYTGFNYLDIYFNQTVTTIPFYNYEIDSPNPEFSNITRINIDQANGYIYFNFQGDVGLESTSLVYSNQMWQYEVLDSNGVVATVPIDTYTLYIPQAFNTGVYEYEWFMTNSQGIVQGENITNGEIYYNGYDTGYTLGFQAGLRANNQESFDNGYSQGVTDGYSQGVTDGYNQGYEDGAGTSEYSFLNLFTAVIDAPVRVFSKFLDFEFLGFNMWSFIKGVIGLAIAIFVIRIIFAKG